MSPKTKKVNKEMLSIATKEKNGNGYIDPNQDTKRARQNTIRRIRRAIRKDGMDLHYRDGKYYRVPIHRYDAIEVETYGRKVGAIQPIGSCVCRGVAWHLVEGLALCDRCAEEVQS